MNETIEDPRLATPTSGERAIKSVLPNRIPVIMTAAFVPWVALVLFTAGSWAALHLIAYALLVLAAGYSIVTVALPVAARKDSIFFIPGAGILAISALSALSVRLGFPLILVPALWLALAAAGFIGLWRDRLLWAQTNVPYGKSLAVLSLLICAVYFLPSAQNDITQRRDGSYQWSDWQTQHFHAIAASIKNSGNPPKSPGTATAELLYHFGPFAPAAAISRMDSLNLGDAVARVTRGASLWALVLSCFGLGTLLSLKATNSRFGGPMSVVGLFFYGSLLATLPDLSVHHHRIAALLSQSGDSRMLVEGGPFGHILMGHSLVHGLGAIAVVMGFCLIASGNAFDPAWYSPILLLPALAVPVNSLAALYCFGTASILLFWGRLGKITSWLPILAMGLLFFAAWKVMGYSQAPDSHAAVKDHLASQWWMLVLWFFAGLGFRNIGFAWIRRPFKDPLAILVLFSVVALLAFSLLLQFRDNNDLYGIYFLQSLFSIFAFSRVTESIWRKPERSQVITQWLTIAAKGLALLCVCGILIGIVGLATRTQTGISLFRFKLCVGFLLLALLLAITSLMKRRPRFQSASSAVLMAGLLIGFLAWTPSWRRFTLQGSRTNLVYNPQLVHGLRHLGELMRPGDRFATNKHSIQGDSLQWPSEHSYGYSALSERPVLLEGYLARGERSLPWFNELLHDNDLLFTSTDPETVREIARKWQVQWLVAAPGTDVSVPKPLPSWLVPQQDCGDLKVYRIE